MSSNEVDMLEQVKGITDQELREKLTSLGMDVGPITGTTRNLYERKLVQLLTGTRSEFSVDSPPKSSPKPSAPKSPPKQSPPKSPKVSGKINFVPPAYDTADGIQSAESISTTTYEPLNDSTVNLIRARKPLSRAVIEEPVQRTATYRQNTPFPAANAQFRKAESAGTVTDHIIKFALFGVVMLVIVYFILNQEPGNAVEQRH